MIELWLQISCDGDNGNCGESANSTTPNQSIMEFLREIAPGFVRIGRGRNVKDFCDKCNPRRSRR